METRIQDKPKPTMAEISKLINELMQVEDLMKELKLPHEDAFKNAGEIRTFCPIHKDTQIRSLVINTHLNTYRCTYSQCPGTKGGDLFGLYCLTTGCSKIDGIMFWSKLLNLPQLDFQDLMTPQLIKAPTEKATPTPVVATAPKKESTTSQMRPVFAQKIEVPIASPKVSYKAEQEPNPTIPTKPILPEAINMSTMTKEKNEDTFENILTQLITLEPDWYHQYQIKETTYLAEESRRGKIIDEQSKALMEYWGKHHQNLKAYQQGILSLDEFHGMERQLIKKKQEQMTQSYALGEQAFRDTYDDLMEDLDLPGLPESKEEVCV